MAKETKNILTRQLVEKELRFYNTADIRSSVLLIACLTPLFGGLAAIMTAGVLGLIDHIGVRIFLLILILPTMTAPIWINLLSLISSLKEKRMLDKGEFEIVKKQLNHKSQKTENRHNHRHIRYYFHFIGFMDRRVDKSTYDMTAEDEGFYLVHLTSKYYIKLFYPESRYDFKQ